MDLTILLIGLAIVIAIIIIGKILKIVTKIIFIIIFIIAVAVGSFWAFNNYGDRIIQKKSSYNLIISDKSTVFSSFKSL